jgi:protein-S-isoprenylcysteine O-methyltransferase Ste14
MDDSAKVKVLPPVVLLVALAVGMIAAVWTSDRLLPSDFAIAVGLATIALSVVLALTAASELRRAKTAFDVRKPTTTIVTTGAFAVTRNPVYLSMMLLYVGIALLVNSPWMLLVAIPTGSALCLMAIRPEERYLTDKFGDDYCRYAASVPRWLSWRSFAGTIRI